MIRFLLSGRRKLITIPTLFIIGLALIILSIALSNTKQLTVSPVPTKTVAGVETSRPSRSRSLATSKNSRQIASITKVVDGDTISVLINGKKETIRIIGINTPETVDPRKTVECFGKEASNKAKGYFIVGSNVWLEADPTQGDRDKYQRLLRYVFINNNSEDYGATMIIKGYAYEYTYNTPYRYQILYKQAQKNAENRKLGLWSDTACAIQPISVSTPPNSPNTPNLPNSAGQAGDKDCKDFTTHAEAQAYFVGKGGSPSNNADKLDSDGDGLACESLP
ncbi:MAG: thermonuclease family protein [Candidatus Levybacteria bacterium]|nr:thermonuclease family protein [Candidatus Levybacteria bacterium]